MILPNSLSVVGVRQVILIAAAPGGEQLALVVFADGTWGITSNGHPLRHGYVVDSIDDGPAVELMHLFMNLAGLPIQSRDL